MVMWLIRATNRGAARCGIRRCPFRRFTLTRMPHSGRLSDKPTADRLVEKSHPLSLDGVRLLAGFSFAMLVYQFVAAVPSERRTNAIRPPGLANATIAGGHRTMGGSAISHHCYGKIVPERPRVFEAAPVGQNPFGGAPPRGRCIVGTRLQFEASPSPGVATSFYRRPDISAILVPCRPITPFRRVFHHHAMAEPEKLSRQPVI